MRFIWSFIGLLFSSVLSQAGKLFFVGRPNTDTIHRFFDSSPFSSEESIIAVTELPRREVEGEDLPFANITVVRLGKDGSKTYEVIDRSLAWSGQLGAQVQMARDKVFYNVLAFDDQHCQRKSDFLFVRGQGRSSLCHRSLRIHGRVYDLRTNLTTYLPCPLYHVSKNGRFTSSVNLWRIQSSQKGYGIDWMGQPSSTFLALHDEGILVNDVQSQRCFAPFSIREIAEHLGINYTTNAQRIVGFHTKWSHDSRLLMFVLRTLENPVSKSSSHVRVQHLLVLDMKNEHHDSKSARIKYVLSWASKPFIPITTANEGIRTRIVQILDGNHPNWKPNSHCITLNLRLPPSLSMGHQAKPDLRPSTSSTWTWTQIASSLFSWLSLWTTEGPSVKVDRAHWYTVAIDVDIVPKQLPLLHQQFQLNKMSESSATDENMAVHLDIVAPIGLGHPSFSPDGRYIVTDTYPKETVYVRNMYSHLWTNDSTGIRLPTVDSAVSTVPLLLFPQTGTLFPDQQCQVRKLLVSVRCVITLLGVAVADYFWTLCRMSLRLSDPRQVRASRYSSLAAEVVVLSIRGDVICIPPGVTRDVGWCLMRSILLPLSARWLF